jgi:hypothetical protein
LDRYLDHFKKSDLVVSALLTAIAIGTHLNGMIYTGAAVLLLWIHRQWKAGFLYGVLGALGLVFYVAFDVRSVAEFRQLVNQFFSWRDVATADYGWSLFLRIISEQRRFLHSPPEIIYSVALVFLLIMGKTAVKVQGMRILTYAALLTFCLAEISHGFNTNYLIYAFPFFVLLLVFSFEFLIQKNRKYRVSAWALVLIFILGNLIYDVSKFKDRDQTSPEYRKITEALPADVYVLAPGPFVVQGLGRQKIQILVAYRDKVENGVIEASPEGIFTEAAKFGIEYIIFGRDDLKYFKITESKYLLYERMPVQPSPMFEIFQRRKNRDGKDHLSRTEIFFPDF